MNYNTFSHFINLFSRECLLRQQALTLFIPIPKQLKSGTDYAGGKQKDINDTLKSRH